ncbi:Kae1/TsaD family [Phytophthora cactorum]|nr:Kae1/TsaD family [Phytophthora cactorum]
MTPPMRKDGDVLAMGIEGSANKLGVGIILYRLTARRRSCPTRARRTSRHRAKASYPRDGLASPEPRGGHQAGISPKQLDCICYTKGPGMGGPLRSAAVCARMLSLLWNKPLIGVNHCVGHIEMGRTVTKAADPVVLYVSGGNTQVIAYSMQCYRISERQSISLLETVWTALLECWSCRTIQSRIQYEVLAREGKNFIELPYIVKGMDVSFSGISTFIEKEAKDKIKSGECTKADLCYSLQETIFAMLVEITERAMAHCGQSEVLIEMMGIMAKERNGRVCAMDQRYCIDNGAMIAQAGVLEFQYGKTTPLKEATCTQRYE